MQLSYSLKSSGFINYIKDRASVNIYNINKYKIVKIKNLIFLQYKLELSRGFAIFLAVKAVPSKAVNNLLINIIIAKTFQYFIQLICQQVSKAVVELVEFSNS